MIKGQLKDLRGRATYEKRRRMCFRGVGVDGITATCDGVVAD